MSYNCHAKPFVRYRSQCHGFTLIEVMVALFIISMAVTALLINTTSIMDGTGYLERKTIAHWVALNLVERERLANRQSNRVLNDEKSGTEEMANQIWHWHIKPLKTANKGFVQLQVRVSDQPYSSQVDDNLVTVLAWMDRYHQSMKAQ